MHLAIPISLTLLAEVASPAVIYYIQKRWTWADLFPRRPASGWRRRTPRELAELARSEKKKARVKATKKRQKARKRVIPEKTEVTLRPKRKHAGRHGKNHFRSADPDEFTILDGGWHGP